MNKNLQTASHWVHLVTQEIILEADCVNTLFWQLLDTMQRFSSAKKNNEGVAMPRESTVSHCAANDNSFQICRR